MYDKPTPPVPPFSIKQIYLVADFDEIDTNKLAQDFKANFIYGDADSKTWDFVIVHGDADYINLDIELEPRSGLSYFLNWGVDLIELTEDCTMNLTCFGDEISSGSIIISGTLDANEEIISVKPQINCYPNPFNPSGAGRNPATTIAFSLAENSKVDISIYNIKGQKVKTITNEQYTSGKHNVSWNGVDMNNKHVSSGVYFYALKVNGKTEAVKKCMLIK